jgi:hypothetical protein
VWWHIVAPALSVACVAVLGVTLLLRNGIPPLQPDISLDEVAGEPVAVSESIVQGEASVSARSKKAVAESHATAESAASGLSVDALVADSNLSLSESTPESAKSSFSTEQQIGVLPSTGGPERESAVSVESGVTGPDAGESAADAIVSAEIAGDYSGAPEVQLHSGRDWLKSEPPGRFTLFVNHQDNTLQPLIAELSQPYAMAEVAGDTGRRWWFITGSFPSAEAAAGQITGGLSSLNVQVVSFGLLPDALRRQIR